MNRRKPITNYTKEPQAGFTIIELLIATSVFSMVLLVILYGVISFTHAYYGGVNSSSTQDAARNIMNSITQAIEFSGYEISPTSQVSGDTYYFCAGGNTYYYILGSMYDGATPSATDPGLFMAPGTCTSSPDFSTAGSKEMLGANMRVTYLSITQSSSVASLYTVSLGLAYGTSDLLCNISKNGSTGGCLKNNASYATNASVIGTNENDVVCKQITGSEFCAHAGLSTSASLRIASGALAP